MEPANLRGAYLDGWKQASYLAGVFRRPSFREGIPTLQFRQKLTIRLRPFRACRLVGSPTKTFMLARGTSVLVELGITGLDGFVMRVDVINANGTLTRNVRCISLLKTGEQVENMAVSDGAR